MASRFPRLRRDVLLLELSFAAGCVDAVSYLGLGQVLTANMTGNTVLLGIDFAQGEGSAALRSGCALGGFCLGVAGAGLFVEGGSRRSPWPRRVTVALAIEGVLLAALAITWEIAGAGGGNVYGLIVLSAIAMGAQSAAVRRIGVSGVSTTYITGTITGAVARLVTRRRPEDLPDVSSRVGLLGTVWAVYLGGAVAGGSAQIAWGAGATWIAVAALGAVVAGATLRPPSGDEAPDSNEGGGG